MKKSSIKWLFGKLFLIVCMIGAALQSLEVSTIYFSYHTVTMTSVYFPTIYLQPQVSFCFPILLVTNFQSLIDHYPDIVDQMNLTGLTAAEMFNKSDSISFSSQRSKLQSAFTNDREAWLINNLTYFANDLVTNCNLLDPGTNLINEVDCWTQFVDTSFFKGDNICYGFANLAEYDDFLAAKVLGSNRMIESFKFNSIIKSANQIFNYYQSDNNDEIPFHKSGFAQQLSLTDYKEYVMTTDRYLNYYLPLPYDTDCFDYDTIGFHSEDHCLESCERNLTIKKYNVLIPSPTFDTKSETLMKLKMRAGASMSPEEAEEFKKIHDICNGKCFWKKCKENIMIPQILSANVADGEFFRITIKLLTTPAKVATFVPTLPILSYLVQLGSITGFWLGFSIFSGYELFETVIINLIARKKGRSNGQ